jgi:predicted transcriptional regulator
VTSLATLKRKILKNPEVKREYERLAPAYDIVQTLIDARVRANMTQAEVAKRMGTTQSAVARMESGKYDPKVTSLRQYAEATGSQIEIKLVSKTSRVAVAAKMAAHPVRKKRTP